MDKRKLITIIIIVLILAVTAYALLMLFGKQLAGTGRPANQTEQQLDQAALEQAKNQKEIDEKMALVAQGFSDALDGQIVGFGADKKTIKVKPDASEQLDENKIIEVSINDETEILRLGYELIPAADEDVPPTIKDKTEKLGSEALQEGMLIQVSTGKMLDFSKESSISAIRIVTSDQGLQE